VNLNGVRGKLTGHVFAPSGVEEELFIEDMDKDLYSCRFIPKENGVYYVHIRFNNVHIPGSPFPMLVGKLGADPAMVLVSGKGLERGNVGEWMMQRKAASQPLLIVFVTKVLKLLALYSSYPFIFYHILSCPIFFSSVF